MEATARRGVRAGTVALIGLLSLARTSAAEVPAPVPAPLTLPPIPEGYGAKQRLSDEDYAKKKEDGYFTGLPLANSAPNTGVGFGARVYFFFNGKREDPLFAYSPYRYRVFLQGFGTTNGLQFHWLDFDAINVLETPYRIRSQAIFERNTNRNYFGIGERSLAPLSFPGDARSFQTNEAYEAAQRQLQPDGTSYARYDKIFFEEPILLLSVERSFFGGVVRPLLGVGLSHATVRDYTGDTVTALDAGGGEVSAPQARTRLREDCDAGRLVGCAGGWVNTLRVGVSYDTRDFEPDPNRGVFVDLSFELGTRALGSDFDFARVLLAPRVYWSPFPQLADLVLAARGLYQVQSRGTPFFGMNVLPFTDDPRIGLGGLRTLRGYRQDRFVGPVMALFNAEIRWTFFDFRALGQRFALIVAPFLDMGRVFDDVRDTKLAGWKRAQGAGFRIAWNQSTIVMIDYGFSREDAGLYINFSHIF
jgi:hypothetical protein